MVTIESQWYSAEAHCEQDPGLIPRLSTQVGLTRTNFGQDGIVTFVRISGESDQSLLESRASKYKPKIPQLCDSCYHAQAVETKLYFASLMFLLSSIVALGIILK